MDPEGQTDPHWEVLGVPPALAGGAPYHPAGHDTADGITLRGVPKVWWESELES